MADVLDAGFVSVLDEEDGLVIGFADDEVETGRYLILQRSRAFDERDVALGMADDVSIERDDPWMSAYGGIERFALSRDRAIVRLDETAAGSLGGSTEIEIRFALDDPAFENLKSGLRRLFEGLRRLVEIA